MKTSSQWRWLSLVVVTTVMFARPAHADPEPGVLALGGTAEPRDLTTIEKAVASQLRSAAWQVPDKPLTKKEIDELMACVNAGDATFTCFPKSIHVRRAFVLSASQQPAPEGTLIVMTAKIIVTEPQGFVTNQRRCLPCNADELEKLSKGLTRDLLAEIAVHDGRTLLAASSNPSGATISLDGQPPIGATPRQIKTSPGEHTVRLEKAGFEPVRRTVIIEENKTVEISIDLRPTGGKAVVPMHGAPTDRPHDDHWWYAPTAITVTGGLVVLGGISLIYIGQNNGSDKFDVYTNATPLGIGMGVVGAAACVVGGLWLGRGPRDSAPAVTATNGGAMFGWTGSF